MSKLVAYRSERDILRLEFIETNKEIARMQDSMSILVERSKRQNVQLQSLSELIEILENPRRETIAQPKKKPGIIILLSNSFCAWSDCFFLMHSCAGFGRGRSRRAGVD